MSSQQVSQPYTPPRAFQTRIEEGLAQLAWGPEWEGGLDRGGGGAKRSGRRVGDWFRAKGRTSKHLSTSPIVSVFLLTTPTFITVITIVTIITILIWTLLGGRGVLIGLGRGISTHQGELCASCTGSTTIPNISGLSSGIKYFGGPYSYYSEDYGIAEMYKGDLVWKLPGYGPSLLLVPVLMGPRFFFLGLARLGLWN